MPASSARQVTATTPSCPDIHTPLAGGIYPKGCRYGQRHNVLKNPHYRQNQHLYLGMIRSSGQEWARFPTRHDMPV